MTRALPRFWREGREHDPNFAIWDAEAKSPVLEPNPRDLQRVQPRDLSGELDELLGRMEEVENGRLALGSRLWAAINAEVTESAYDAGVTEVTTSPRVQGWVTITNVVATVPSGATGTLYLGAHTIDLPAAGIMNLLVRIQLGQTDTRKLTVTSSGTVSLMLCGHVSPMQGQLPV